jgi:hypothetical protein
MKAYRKNGIDRREFLRTLSASASVATIAAPVFATQAHADSETTDEKRKARYKADSSDIKAYYRVNRYPN